MAEAILEVVLENLSKFLENELGLFLGVNQEMRRLSGTLSTIRAVLEDAEEKQVTDMAIRNWLQKLKNAAHFLDDILDECATEGLRFQYERQSCRSTNRVRHSFLSSLHPVSILFRYKIARKMKNIRVLLDEIADEKRKFHFCETVIPRKNEVMEWRQTGPVISQPQLYGREGDKERVVDFLVSQASSSDGLSVYPIVGMGGLGKTTLAQLVFNDEKITKHFQLKIWVCVSQNFDVKKMLKAIMESATGHSCESLDLDPLQRKIQETLQRKRSLIVLDDVWNDDPEKWDRLKCVLSCGSRGSSIIVTTRLARVASIMETQTSHQLSGLSIGDCWELFKQRAFGPDKKEHAQLADIGKEIVKKCGGVPLAAKALGGLLRFTREEIVWLNVKESKLWNLPQDENSILSALRLSYWNLPFKVRPCFAYCAIFPKGKEINKHLLIQLWLANGFITPHGKLDVEDVGNEMWKELYWRSFFQDIQTDEFGIVASFKMHDLVHDLAQSVMREECHILDNTCSGDLSEKTRHLSAPIYRLRRSHFGLSEIPKSLRTSLHVSNAVSSVSLLMKCTSLRALHESGSETITDLPSSIGNLKHLRYLNLSGTQIKKLPKSICSLWNLQVLILSYCWNLRKLPKRVNHLKGLQELMLDGCSSLTSMPPGIGQLTSLRILTRYIVGKDPGLQISELGRLNLQNNLTIEHLERIRGVIDAKEANLVSKELKELSLSWDANIESSTKENAEQMLEALEPHAKLSSLHVEGYRGAYMAQWMSNPSFEHLFSMNLVSCHNCLELPRLGKLPSLKHLRLSGMYRIPCINNETNNRVKAFPSLESLELCDLANLEYLCEDNIGGNFPCLSRMFISRCPKLALPILPSVKDLVLIDCKEVSLSSIYNLYNLRFLQISASQELTTFPPRMLRGLRDLEQLNITYCSELESFPGQMLEGQHCLRAIKIDSCQKLKSLWEGFEDLSSLETLEIIECRELAALPNGIIHLTSLQRLVITSYVGGAMGTMIPVKLETLPESLGYISSLQYLKISALQNLASLPELGNLVSLRTLEVSHCPKLLSLPASIQRLANLLELKLKSLRNLASLPNELEGLASLEMLLVEDCPNLPSLPMSIQSLPNLKSLAIADCPELQRRYKKETGEYWHKIAHIPCVKFYPKARPPKTKRRE
ncbi:disease resistance protein RGA2-like [Neltuma alba]|uniref:disease resistance protein RGA2-like n=1 Tax=Neltuma alba TaxID=207710 RepID=UPI0010A2E2D1|nr:disease resistance protein RGA2-like [Prosopis alba]